MKHTSIDFVGGYRRWAAISGLLLLVSIVALGVRGLNLSIDFEGGSSFVLEGVSQPDLSSEDLRSAATGAGATDVIAQVETTDGAATGALVRTAAVEPGGEQARDIQAALVEVSGADDVQVTFVGPTWGERISQKALQALIVFLIVVALYITLRLEAKMAGAAILALVHDIFITVGIYALVGFLVSPSTVIALLTILGYSLYDTVVVFDRVEETVGYIGEPGRRTYNQAVNTAMNEVFWRSLNTSITSLAPVGGLLFIGSQLLGATTLADLALALFVGMGLGTYSSLFVAGPFLAWWKSQEPDYAKLERRIEEEEGEAPPTLAEDVRDIARAPITSDYVRGPGSKPRRERKKDGGGG